MNEDVSLREVARQEYVGVSESDTVAATLELLATEHAEYAVVLRGQDAIGMVTPPDLYTVLAEGSPADIPITAVMGDLPPTLSASDHVDEATTHLVDADTSRILVTDEDGVVGILDARDVLAVTATRREPARVEGATINDSGVETYESQSICEDCGSLSRDLVEFNGQLLCPACRPA
ncbi:MAG: CBS domain-containing protein [Halobacteriaceae archaeon]